MAFTTNLPQPVSLGCQSLSRPAYTFLPKRTSCVLQQKNTREFRHGDSKKRKTNKRSSTDVKLYFVSSCLKDDSYSILGSSSNPPTDIIQKFYKCINEKNLKELSSYISEDCRIEDSLFTEPFIGKKSALKFFEELTQSMGPDVKFRIRSVYERSTFGAGAIWHLVWKNIEIPFTKGCTFIDVRNEERRTIRKAQIIIEPQVKAGHLILENLSIAQLGQGLNSYLVLFELKRNSIEFKAIMKLVTLMLAKYPAIPEWLIKVSQQRWVMWISKICIILLKLLLDSFLKSYLTITYCGAQLYINALKFLHYIIELCK